MNWHGAFSSFVSQEKGFEPLVSEAVDLPEVAGTCDPLDRIPENLRAPLEDPAAIFPNSLPWKPQGAHTEDETYPDYVKLCVRELACGKLRLRRAVSAIGSVFAVGKANGRQRKIWNGAGVSALATKPPKPERLANPSTFVDIETRDGDELFFSKRDAATYFDALRVPKSLQQYFGQPPVRVSDLLAHSSWDMRDVHKFVDDLGGEDLCLDEEIYPINVVWPMGFSWSSCVAQANTVACAVAAGVDIESIMSSEHRVPAHQDELVWIATDDTIMLHRDYEAGMVRLQSFDNALAAAHIPRNVEKDVTLQPSITGLGCRLSASPPLAEPSSSKALSYLLGALDLVRRAEAAPEDVNSHLGLAQWFCLLQRPAFAMFDKIYSFVRKEPVKHPASLPSKVLLEIAAFACIMPSLRAGLDRPWHDELLACDAAPEYGFGVVASTPCPCIVADVARYAERRGDYVKLYRDEADEPEKPRQGYPHALPLRHSDFRTIISSRAKYLAHSGILEGHGLLVVMKWFTRSLRNHGKRLAVLIDAKAVLGATAKGRTNAPGLRSVVRSLGAYQIASDTLLRLTYIPSEHNPADLPSRGRRRRFRTKAKPAKAHSRFGTRTDRMLEKQLHALAALHLW